MERKRKIVSPDRLYKACPHLATGRDAVGAYWGYREIGDKRSVAQQEGGPVVLPAL